jgi:uncharacterized protein (TIGR03790 family)
MHLFVFNRSFFVLRMKIPLFFLTFALLALPAFAATPEDILVVYNKKVSQSRAVAEYYAHKRIVPAENIIGVSVTGSEKISYQQFAAYLVPPIRKKVFERKQAGQQSILLLVYGIPLKIGKLPKIDADYRAKQIQARIDSLETLITGLTVQLDRLAAVAGHEKRRTNTPAAEPSESGSVLTRAQQAMQKALANQKDDTGARISQEDRQQMLTLLIRLAGMSTVLRSIRFDNTDTQAHDNLYKWASLLEQQILPIRFTGVTDESLDDIASTLRLTQGLLGELAFWQSQKNIEMNKETEAAVDSELAMLLKEPYMKARWLPNPHLSQFDSMPGIEQIRANTIMVARLDGPDPETAKRLVDDAMHTEANGLQGTFYIDARGMKEYTKNKSNKKKSYYRRYDSRLRKLHDIVRKYSTITVVLDNNDEPFPEKSCPDAALYCGWYSLGKYIDSFSWQKGAIGFHVASSEASTLRKANSQVWCKRMLENGVAATLGPVKEPYLQSFPLPDSFFPLLMTGQYPLIEVYYRTTPYLSWRQVLIGDPLYKPFKKQPAIDPGWREDLDR